MVEIIKIEKLRYPALRFIGKRCTGDIGQFWDEWFTNDWFAPLNALGKVEGVGKDAVGFMVDHPEFVFWIGMFTPAGSVVPEGYDYMDFDESDVGICWVKGKEETGELFECWRWIQEIGKNNWGTFKKEMCYFQHYDGKRFTEKNTDGNVILDFGIYFE